MVRAKVRLHLSDEAEPQRLCAPVRRAGTPGEILRKGKTDMLVGEPQEKWSAQEHAGHLLDLEPLWMARVDDFLY